jgi:hypothetical protein
MSPPQRPVSGAQVADLYHLQNDLDNNPTVCHSRVIHLTVKVYNEWFLKHLKLQKPCLLIIWRYVRSDPGRNYTNKSVPICSRAVTFKLFFFAYHQM